LIRARKPNKPTFIAVKKDAAGSERDSIQWPEIPAGDFHDRKPGSFAGHFSQSLQEIGQAEHDSRLSIWETTTCRETTVVFKQIF
jgi:hypothetical protein